MFIEKYNLTSYSIALEEDDSTLDPSYYVLVSIDKTRVNPERMSALYTITTLLKQYLRRTKLSFNYGAIEYKDNSEVKVGLKLDDRQATQSLFDYLFEAATIHKENI